MDILSYVLGYKKGVKSGGGSGDTGDGGSSGGGSLPAGVYWEQETPQPLTYYGVHFVYNGELYYWCATAASTSACRMYKYADGGYTQLFSFQSVLAQSAVKIIEYDGVLHAFDGSVYHYTVDLGEGTVTKKSTMPKEGATFVWNGSLYCAALGAIYKWDAATDTWAECSDISDYSDLYWSGLYFYYGNNVYCAYGQSLYKIADGSFTAVGTIAATPNAGVVHGDYFYYLASRYKLYKYDLVNNVSTQVGNAPYIGICAHMYVYDDEVRLGGNSNANMLNMTLHVVTE